MAVNAVSSVYGVSKAGASTAEAGVALRAGDERVRSQRNDPAATAPAESRSQRQFDRQQQALVQGVLAAFSPAVDGGSEPVGDAAAGVVRPVPTVDDPNPQLDQAILKFVHALFNVLREFDTVGTYDFADAVVSAPATGFGSFEASPLAGQLSALAQRYGAAAPEAGGTDPLAARGPETVAGADDEALPVDLAALGAAAPSREPDAQLASAYAEVMAALQGDMTGASDAVRQSSRAELSALLQRLSQAMQAAPVFGGGLPTRGTLLSARA